MANIIVWSVSIGFCLTLFSCIRDMIRFGWFPSEIGWIRFIVVYLFIWFIVSLILWTGMLIAASVIWAFGQVF